MGYPETCSTCNEPHTGNLSPCSNAFHACRECTWDCGVIVNTCKKCQEEINEKWGWYIRGSR